MIPRAAPPTDPRSGPRREVAARARWACAFLVGLALSGCSPLAPTPPERETDGNPEGVTVVRVIDGDTLAVEPLRHPASNQRRRNRARRASPGHRRSRNALRRRH